MPTPTNCCCPPVTPRHDASNSASSTHVPCCTNNNRLPVSPHLLRVKAHAACVEEDVCLPRLWRASSPPLCDAGCPPSEALSEGTRRLAHSSDTLHLWRSIALISTLCGTSSEWPSGPKPCTPSRETPRAPPFAKWCSRCQLRCRLYAKVDVFGLGDLAGKQVTLSLSRQTRRAATKRSLLDPKLKLCPSAGLTANSCKRQ